MFDLRTLVLVSAFTAGIFSLATLLVALLVPQERSLRTWAIGAFLIFVGTLLIAVRGAIPEFISIVIANPVLTLGYGFLYLGSRQLLGLNSGFPWHWIVAVITLPLFYFYMYAVPSVAARIVISNASVVPFLVASAWLFWRTESAFSRVIDRPTAVVLFVGALLTSIRAAMAPFANISTDYFNTTSSLVLNLAPFYRLLMFVWLAIMLALKVSGRLQNALRQDMAAIQEDRESLHLSEERLRLALDAANLAWFDIDLQTGQVNVSAEYPRMIGYAADEFQTDLQNWVRDIHPEDRDSVSAAFRECVEHGGQSLMEYRLQTKSGGWKWLRSMGKIVQWNAQKKAARMIGIHIDITERKQAEHELVAAREAAEAANRAKSEFLANMSHEIRTPLNGVIGNAQLLEMSEPTSEQKEYLSAIMLSGSNLLSLINDILDLSKIEAEKVVLEQTDFSLRGCFNNVVRTQRSRIANKGLSLKLQIPNEVPDALIGDELRVKQVLLNLLGNAIKFTKEGGITLSAAIREHDGSKALIELAVTDTGIGIPKAVADDIFKPFVQGDSSITRQYGGSGLGLTISRRLAELMGGSIAVQSSEGVGTTFRVLLPFPVAHQVVQEQIAPAAAPTVLWAGAPLKILLAEDNEINQQFGVALLKKMGHRVILVENGKDALAALGREAFDLVLMDIQMPVMNGDEALAELRERERGGGAHLPAIALTAYALKGDEAKFLAAGFDGYVSKPLEVNKLIGEMQRVLKLTCAADTGEA